MAERKKRKRETVHRERMVDAIREILGKPPLYTGSSRFDVGWMSCLPRRPRSRFPGAL